MTQRPQVEGRVANPVPEAYWFGVHVPRCCQPLCDLSRSLTSIKVFLVPTKVAVALSDRFSVRV